MPQSSPGSQFLAGAGPAPAARISRLRDGVAVAALAGETVLLLAERALHWPRARTLFVADVHLGKGAAFRAGGVAIPRGATANDLARLATLIERTQARRLVILGDFLHAATGWSPSPDRSCSLCRQGVRGCRKTATYGQPFVGWRTVDKPVHRRWNELG